MSHDLLRSFQPAIHWHNGYPVGNGKTGAMIFGDGYCEKMSLNYDTLWRRNVPYSKRNTGKDFEKIRQLCLEGKWDEAQQLTMRTIPATSETVYLNAFVPVGDLYISLGDEEHILHDYERSLDMSSGVAESSFTVKGVTYKRETVSVYDGDLIIVRLSASRPASLFGGIALSRLDDPECEVDGYSAGNTGEITGRFEEGVTFAARYTVLTKGGRITGYNGIYRKNENFVPEPENKGTLYQFRKRTDFDFSKGIHCYFDSVDEAFIVVALSDDSECKDGKTVGEIAETKISDFLCRYDLFEDYDKIIQENTASHRKYYDAVSLDLSDDSPIADEYLLRAARSTGETSPVIVEKLFNMGRYLAICSGRPNGVCAPINLQGIWNQDRRPAWESDYHLDMNVQMSYWSLASVGLTELYKPLIDWAVKLMPQARVAAQNLYRCNGICFATANDFNQLGNYDNLGYPFTGAAAWLAQTIYRYFEYTADTEELKNKIYPFIKETALFYEDFLYETEDGKLIPVPSASMEAGVKGRNPWSVFSSPSAMELELIHWTLQTAAHSAKLLNTDGEKIQKWLDMDKRVPFFSVDSAGVFKEWDGDETIEDPGHRHRSPLIGLCPGNSVNYIDTPELMSAAEKLLEIRRKNAPLPKVAWEKAWDVQLFARLHNAEMARQALKELVQNFMLPNFMLTTTNTVSDTNPIFDGLPLLQIEASLGLISAVTDCIIEDRDCIRFLPALPENWKNGRLCGILLKSGLRADITWADGKLCEAVLTAIRQGEALIELSNDLLICPSDKSVDISRIGEHVKLVFENETFVIRRKYEE